MGTSKMSHRQLAQEIELYTGGINASTKLITSPFDFHQLTGSLYFSGSAFERNVDHLFRLLYDIMTDVNFFQTELLRTYINEVFLKTQFNIDLFNFENSYLNRELASFKKL